MTRTMVTGRASKGEETGRNGCAKDRRKKVWRVLARLLPRIITTEEEHEWMLAKVEKPMDKGERRTAEQDAALDLMVRLIQDYDERN
jgi:hypothetical protein